ncbi:imelysin family protein [Leifsonia sp. NPDC058230]|uniref:imelysin family protein n=1 Tax=Leifsonia sp. NPDC058230 TaxID=3346391 RepID=UPI0036DC3597
MSKRSRFAVFFTVVGVIIAVGVVLTIAVRPGVANAAPHPGTYAISAGQDACGAGWGSGSNAHVPGGDQTFTVTNGTIAGIEVYLQAVDTSKVYLDLEGLGTGAHAKARVTLGSGRYRFVCLPADADPVRGPTVTVGAAPPAAKLTPGIVPVTRNDLIPVAKAYGDWVGSRIPVLAQQVAALGDDAAEGDLSAARRDWLTAHETYETLGAAYGAFGDLDSAIDGTPAPGLTASTDPDLTGFHKVEAALWSGAPAAVVAASVAPLASAVDQLGTAFSDAEIDPQDIGLRAHEIVENAIQFELTGATDAGSGTELATIDANLTGAQQALNPLTTILTSRYDELGATTTSLTSAQKLVESFRQADGAWTPLVQLNRSDRERLDAALGNTVELLAPVAAICDIRRDA